MRNKFSNRKFAGKINIIIVVLLLMGCRTNQGPENVRSMKRIQIWKETEEALDVYANAMDDKLQEYIKEAENAMEKQVQVILEQNSAVWSGYLQNYPAEIKWIDIYRFDFTGDGQDEIILSMEYAQNDVISYNYVFDLEGNQIMKFPWGWLSNTEIYCGEDKNTYYLQVDIHFGASDDATLYGRITKQEQWQFELMFLEWDVRSGAERVSNQKEGYYIYDNFSVEEAENIWDGIQGIKRIYDEKEKAKDREQLEAYLKIYESWEKREAACVQMSDEEYK